MDLSKAFECIPYELLIAKLHAYGLDFDTVTFLHNYLKHRKKGLKINNIFSFFRTALSGVSLIGVSLQALILGPILLNIFINGLFLCLTKSDLHNFENNLIYKYHCFYLHKPQRPPPYTCNRIRISSRFL